MTESLEGKFFTELTKIEERDEDFLKILQAPIQFNYSRMYKNPKTDFTMPKIERIYQVKQHPEIYIVTDSTGDQYFIGTVLSKEEGNFIDSHREEYNKKGSIKFQYSDLPERTIFRAKIPDFYGETYFCNLSFSYLAGPNPEPTPTTPQ